MKKLALVASVAAFAAAPAFATTYSVEFAVDGGETTTVDIADDVKYDADTRTLCADQDGAEVCVTLSAELHNAGDSATFTSSDGKSGTATLKSVQ